MSRQGRRRRSGPHDGLGGLAVAALMGALVAVALGVYGRTHEPTGRPLALVIGFSGMTPMKAWLATFGVLLGVFQVVTAAWMWGRLPITRKAPAWAAEGHRWSGAVAFVLTLPVGYHCLWSLGFVTFDTRTALHSIAGCAFYGVFATKMLSLRTEKLPGWALPLVGGALFTLLVALWATASLWYFSQPGVPLR
ncbi:DUF6529 family protein [Kribbella sp. NPDC023855]|uniref:DUF6529 family protein n=1 Tax=Kribbella sp. NPDC023855 TaxID=3154698 RepID=UPI0033E874D6